VQSVVSKNQFTKFQKPHTRQHNDQANLPGAAGQRKQILPKTPPGSTGSG